MVDHRATRNQLRHSGCSFRDRKDRHLDPHPQPHWSAGGWRLALALPRPQSGMLLSITLPGSRQPVTEKGGPGVGYWHLASSSSLPYLSRLPTLLRTEDTDEQGHSLGWERGSDQLHGGVHALPVAHPGGKGLGPKNLKVSGTRNKGTSARHGSELLGEKTGVCLVTTGLGLWCHIAYSQGNDVTDYQAVISSLDQLRSTLKRAGKCTAQAQRGLGAHSWSHRM